MSAAVIMRCTECGSLDLVSSALVKFNTGDVVEYDSHPTHCAECLSTEFRPFIHPKDVILAALYAADDNGHDMYDLDNTYVVDYAVGVIVSDILDPAGGCPEVGYLTSMAFENPDGSQFDNLNEDCAPYSRAELRPHLMDAVAEYLRNHRTDSAWVKD